MQANQNILWADKATNAVMLTVLLEVKNPEAHAAILAQQFPGYTAMEYNIDINARFPAEVVNNVLPVDVVEYVAFGQPLAISLPKAKEAIKAKLRNQRAPLLANLDVQFQRNLEIGADNTAVVAEKQRLRDITLLVDAATTLQEALSITI